MLPIMVDQVHMPIALDVPTPQSLKIEQPEPLGALAKHHDVMSPAIIGN